MSSRSISGELSRKIIIAIAVLVLGGIFGIIMFSGRVVLEFSRHNAENSLSSFTADVEDMLSEVEVVKASVEWMAQEHIDDPSYLDVVNDKLVSTNPLIVSASVSFDPDTLASGIPASDSGEWSEPHADGQGRLVTSYSAPLRNLDGDLFAVYTVDASLDAITSRLAQELFYEDSYSVILSREGNVISHPDSTLLMRNISDIAASRDDKRFTELADSMKAGESGIGEIRSEKAIAIYGPVHNGWSLAMICPGDTIFGGVVRFQLLILLISLADLLVLYLVTRAIIGRTLLPITEVTYLAKNVAKGNFKAKIPQVEGRNEMYHLHEALRNMLHSINDYIAQLKTTTAANERFESELSIASNIQKHMLRTDFINDDEVDLFAKLMPAKEVGGDMYDFLRVDRSIYFAVGDVSGKGVPAALYMAISRSLFHYVSGKSMSTSNIVSCINSSFCSGNDTSMFITLFVGRLDLDTRELVFCNAGHNPIVLISPDGKASFIHAKSNIAAGVFDEYPYEKESMIVEKGSRLLIYTDGVTEAEDASKAQYGEDRLLEFANSQRPDLPSELFVEKLLGSMKSFTKDNEQNDDITILSVRV